MISRELFGIRLKALRLSLDLSHGSLAKELNLSKALIGHWENGVRLPSLEAADALADYFFVSLDYLVGRSDDPQIEESLQKAEEKLLEILPSHRIPTFKAMRDDSPKAHLPDLIRHFQKTLRYQSELQLQLPILPNEE